MANQQLATFVQLIALAPVGDNGRIFRSKTPAWAPLQKAGVAAYGGHVYAQAAWAASQSVSKEMIVHNVHGFFTLPGLVDRPFVYDVKRVSDGRSYCTRSVTVRQPLSAYITSPLPTAAGLDHFFGEFEEKDLGEICYTCICSFKKDEDEGVSHQEVKNLNKTYGSVLAGRRPENHYHAPSVDAPVRENAPFGPFALPLAFSRKKTDFPITKWYHKYALECLPPLDFPGIEVRKVDMTAFNKGVQPLDYRQLSYYRSLGSIPASEPNLHACAHLFASDRNSLFVISNALGIPDQVAKMGSLSHSVVFHVRSEKLLFGEDLEDGAWFCQEAWTPRSEGGRGIHESKIWNENGLHVASTWQEGLVRKATAHSEDGRGTPSSLQNLSQTKL